MQRKVNRVGKGTLTVSLPADWAKKNKLSSESTLEVREFGKDLNLSVENSSPVLKGEINLIGTKRYARKCLVQAYKKGFDEVKVTFDSPDMFKDVTDILGVMVGFEIMEQGRNYIIFKNIATKLEDDIDKLLKRNLSITSGMLEDIKEVLEKGDKSLLEQVIKSEHINNRLCLLGERIVCKNGYSKDHLSGPFVVVFLYKLENIADSYKIICKELLKNKSINHKDTLLKIIDLTMEVQNSFLDFFNKNDTKILGKIQSLKERYSSEIMEMIKGKDCLTAFYATTLLSIIMGWYDLAGIHFAIYLSGN